MRDPISDTFHFLTARPLWFNDAPSPSRWGVFPTLLFWALAIGAAVIAARVWKRFPEQRNAKTGYLGFARFLLGAMWFQATLWKLPPTFTGNPDGTGGLRKWTGLMADGAAFGFHRALTREVILPNFELFAYQVWAGETLIAILLMLGLFTRVGALLGLLMALNLWLGLYNVPHEWGWTYAFLALLMGFLIATRAGRALGADALLAGRSPPKNARLRKLLDWAT